MSAKYAVLGLLLERPSYGYELLTRFRDAFGAAGWGVSAQALYAALDRLERDGSIEPVGEPQHANRRQPRRPYVVTATGVAELHRFLDAPMGPEPSRAELLVRLHCAGEHGAGALARMLDAHERACREELRDITDRARPAALAELLAREQRRLVVEARLTWIDYARQELRAAPPASSGASHERVAAA